MSHATLTGLPQWQALQRHFQDIGGKHLRELFAGDPKRGEALTVEREDFTVAELDPMQPHHLHIQALVGVTMTGPEGKVRRGRGVLEQLAMGPHAPTGLTGVIDPA